jgi:hypothetical protein
MSMLFQDVAATLLALGAVATIVYRIAGIVRPATKAPGCASCSSCPETHDPGKTIKVQVVSRS